MSNRVRRMPPAESHPIGDASKLMWERFINPMQAAAAQMNAAIANTQNILAGVILEREGFSPDTHVFNLDTMRIVSRPKGNGNATLD